MSQENQSEDDGVTERKIAVITGAGSATGRGLSRIVDERGMQLVLADVDEAGPQEYAKAFGEWND